MITYLKGDATVPVGEGKRHIIHVCNTEGGWGKGFVLALSRRWSAPEAQYRSWYSAQTHSKFGPFALGNVGWVKVEPDIWVVNMIAQKGYGPSGKAKHREPNDTSIPLQYDALRECLLKVAVQARLTGASIHGPRFGSGLAGGSWYKIEALINETLGDLHVYIYDL